MELNGRARRQRETFLGTLLAALAACGFLFVFFLICGGLSVYVLAVVAAVVGLCFINYVVWGRSLSRQTAGEREEAALEAELEAGQEGFEHFHGRPGRGDWSPDEGYQGSER